MNTGLIAARYSEALSEYARQLGVEDQVYADSVDLLAKLKALKKGKDDTVSEEVLTEAIGGCCEALQRFLQIVIRNGRTPHIIFILQTFGRRYRWDKGVAKVRITTADESWQPALKQRVEQSLLSYGWNEVVFRFSNDESLIGGYVLQLRDQRIDASIATQLRVLKNELTEKNHQL